MLVNAVSFMLVSLTILYGDVNMSDDLDITSIHSRDPEIRSATVHRILSHRRKVGEECIDVLKQARREDASRQKPAASNDIRFAAIQLLSAYRDPNAVDELLRVIEIKRQTVFRTEAVPFTLNDYYPATGALVKIGKPAVRPAVWALTKDGSAQRRENLCWVIGKIEGPKAGRWRIEEMIAEVERQIKEAEAKGLHPSKFQAQITQIKKLRSAIPILEELFATEKQ